MAHDVPEHEFRKLHLDTYSCDTTPSSPFASISHDDTMQDEKMTNKVVEDGLGISTSQPSSMLSSQDLTASWYSGDDVSVIHSEGQHEKAVSETSVELLGGRQSSLEDVERKLRERGTSISFDPQAVLDDGRRHSVEDPLPKPGSGRRRTRGRSMANALENDPTASPRINPFTGEPIKRRTRRSDIAPKLPTLPSQDNANNLDGAAHSASLTSTSTASPPQEEIQTPISPGIDMLPSPAYSPLASTEPWPAFRNGSIRSSRISSRPISLRRESRRSSKRSLSAGFSPASAFLSQWGRESISSTAPEPDDEGQSFGLNNEYIIGRQIGYGGFSVVREAFSMSDDGEKCRRAVKIVRKAVLDKVEPENDKCQQNLEHEVEIWRYLQHKHILPLHAVYDTEFATFCVMDLIGGGSLFDIVRASRKKDVKGLSSQLAKRYAFQLASALRYLHEDIRIVHRDVKLENCLIDLGLPTASTEGGLLKLCDFGLAEFITNDRHEMVISSDSPKITAASIVGTTEYAAPEIMQTEKPLLNPGVDIWAFGVCVHALVTGDLPFRHTLKAKTLELIAKGEWDEEKVRQSQAAKQNGDDGQGIVDLLRGCLEVERSARWNIANVLSCGWFEGCGDPYDGGGVWETVS